MLSIFPFRPGGISAICCPNVEADGSVVGDHQRRLTATDSTIDYITRLSMHISRRGGEGGGWAGGWLRNRATVSFNSFQISAIKIKMINVK